MTRASVVAGVALLVGGIALTSARRADDPQARDVPPPQNRPTERLIAIGSATITGTVTAADTGRPIRGASVGISATIGAAPTSGPLIGNPVGTLGRGRPAGSPIITSVSRQAVTDAAGRFSIERLPAGSYLINVSRQQFLANAYGQRKPGGQGRPVALADGQTLSLNITLVRGGSISGTVYNEDGDPQTQTQVSAWRVVMTSGVRRVQQQGGGSTDDRGMYRLFGLQPGDYFVSATPFPNGERMTMDRIQAETEAINNAIASGGVRPPAAPGMPSTVAIPVQNPQQFVMQGPMPGYLPTFAPNVDVPSKASPVHVAGGDEHTNVDIQLRLVEASQIAGMVTSPLEDGVGVQISLVPEEASFDVGSLSMARMEQDGKFTLRNVPPGKYMVLAQTVAQPQRGAAPVAVVGPGGVQSFGPPPMQQLTSAQHLFAQVPVEVAGQSVINVSLALKPGKSISGMVVFDYKTQPLLNLSQGRLNITLSPAPWPQIIQFGPQPSAQVGPDGRFTLTGVIAGRYSVRGNFGLMRSSMANGQDTLDFPLNFTAESDLAGVVITMTDTTTELSGHLMDAAGKPALDYTIVLASTDERFWTPGSRRILTARTDATGAYMFRNMPPGTYLLGAVTDLEPGGQFDPELLQSLRGASRTVTVDENGKVVQDLRVGK
jgi:hypothetical protein